MIDRQILKRGASHAVIATALAGLALSACQPNGPQAAASSAPTPLSAIPLTTSGAAVIAPAPFASDLPPAPSAYVGRLADPRDRYAFADRAYAMSSAFGDAPPDYTFDYGGGERPWVWRGDDQSTRVAEPLPDGGYRYYYYEAGSRTPYLVRDPDQSYGYDNGALVVVYDRQGRALSPDYLNRQADMAGRFLSRAEAIYAASQRSQREAVAQANWSARRSRIDAERGQWAADQAADRDWQAYHAAHDQQEQAQWDAERYRREAQAARFAETINDTQLAAQDWQAARRAQNRAAAAGQLPPSQRQARGVFGFAPQPQAQPPAPPPPQQAQFQGQPPAQAQQNGPDQSRHDHRPPPGPPGNVTPGPNAAAQADALRRAQDQAQAAHQAQFEAQRQAELATRAQGLGQAQAARQAQLEAQHQAQLAAHAQGQAQAQAARQGQLEAQRQAQLAARAQGQAQAQAARQAQFEAQHQAQLAARAQGQAQAQAARQAQVEAQHQAQLAARAQGEGQAQAARQAQVEAQRQAQVGAQAAAHAQGQAEAARQAAARAQSIAHATPPSRRVKQTGENSGDHQDATP